MTSNTEINHPTVAPAGGAPMAPTETGQGTASDADGHRTSDLRTIRRAHTLATVISTLKWLMIAAYLAGMIAIVWEAGKAPEPIDPAFAYEGMPSATNPIGDLLAGGLVAGLVVAAIVTWVTFGVAQYVVKLLAIQAAR